MKIRLGKLWFDFEYGSNEIIGEVSFYLSTRAFRTYEKYGLNCNPSWTYCTTDKKLLWTGSADDVIKYLEYCLQKTKKTVLKIWYPHPFWLIHDYLHAKERDLTMYGCDRIDEYTETKRLIKALDICKKRNIRLGWELLDDIRTAHYRRYHERINIKKYYENDEYCEWREDL